MTSVTRNQQLTVCSQSAGRECGCRFAPCVLLLRHPRAARLRAQRCRVQPGTGGRVSVCVSSTWVESDVKVRHAWSAGHTRVARTLHLVIARVRHGALLRVGPRLRCGIRCREDERQVV